MPCCALLGRDDAGDHWQLMEAGMPKGVLSMDDHKKMFGFPVPLDPQTGYVYALPLTGDEFRYPIDSGACVSLDRCGAELASHESGATKRTEIH